MKIFQFNNVLYNGNINRDFYLYCLQRNKKILKYLFLNIWYLILSYLFVGKKDIYEKKKFNYLREVTNLNKTLKEFYTSPRLNCYFEFNPDVIIDKAPAIFIKKQFPKTKIIGYTFDDNFDVKLEKYNKDVAKTKQADALYLSSRKNLVDVTSNSAYIVRNKKIKYLNKRPDFKKFRNIFGILILSFIVTCFSFLFTCYDLDLTMYYSYFEPKLFLLNFIPIFLFILLIYLISKRIHVAWLISTILIVVWGIANQSKLGYRDDVVKFEDFGLIKEALIMAEKVDIAIKLYTIAVIILSIIFFFIIKKHFNKNSMTLVKRSVLIVCVLLIMLGGYKTIYTNKKVYDSVGDLSLVNKWIFTRQSQVRGLVYPFIYTASDGVYKAPANYNEEKVRKILDTYKYQNIPDDKKVNIIAIMLESYNDFSKFKEIKFKEDIYKNFHDIQKKSISGNLVVNIFGGGTVATERSFITGYTDFNSLRKKTNSYVWYFKQQGYRTEAMHPIYGAFYNRNTINANLGFDKYYNYENTYSKIDDGFARDDVFFDTIIDGYERAKKDKIPYFNFSVTYQNHVPYNVQSYEGKEYFFDNDSYDPTYYNMINEYLSGIKETNIQLKKLINYFDNEREPVLVVLFGDHNPALGDDAFTYHDLGINVSLDTIEGFLNYYEIPFVIHANDAAKEKFDNTFEASDITISPIFLMNELFDNMGLKGNQYLQYMHSLRKNVDVIHRYYYKENGKFVSPKKSKYKEAIADYNAVSYFQITSRPEE